MRLKAFAAWALRIPYVEAFRDGVRDRAWYDALIVRVEDASGEVGYGEGAPRHEAGETGESALRYVSDTLWPGVADRELPDIQTAADLMALGRYVRGAVGDFSGAFGSGCCALEIAIADCALRRRNRCMVNVLPPFRQKVQYGGLLASSSREEVLSQVKQMRSIGLATYKLEVGFPDDVERVRAVRDAIGQAASLRLDAGGTWTPERALDVLWAVAPCRIEAIEQPLAPGPVSQLARFKRECPVPVMADESLVTPADGLALIDAGAVDFFNIRLSKCGGLSGALELVDLARRHGVRFQIGSQIGETAILAAMNRHLAAHLEDVAYVEGSYGTLLLSEDVSPDGIRFGHRGEAPVLLGKGLGVRVLEDRLRRFAVKEVSRVVPSGTFHQARQA